MKPARVLFFAVVAVGCGPKNEGSSAEGETGDVPADCAAAGWDTSLATYESLAEQAGDTYWYSINTPEFLGGFEASCLYRTTVEVSAGVIVRREFELVQVNEPTLPEECTGVPFIEEGDEVGTTVEDLAVPAYTMEELYSRCCDLLSLEPSDMYSDSFDVAADGVIASCFTIENGCGEGCEASVDGFRGFRFSGFGFGSPPP